VQSDAPHVPSTLNGKVYGVPAVDTCYEASPRTISTSRDIGKINEFCKFLTMIFLDNFRQNWTLFDKIGHCPEMSTDRGFKSNFKTPGRGLKRLDFSGKL